MGAVSEVEEDTVPVASEGDPSRFGERDLRRMVHITPHAYDGDAAAL